MRFRILIEIDYGNEKIARTIYSSLEPDNDILVRSRLEDGKLWIEIECENPMTLIRTIEDLFRCQKVAEDLACDSR